MEENKEVEIKIPIEELFPEFIEHLGVEKNNRIFFSGKFGIGKTYFLNEFFKNQNDKYEVFHLYPVNYQISPNEDIIELLKYDILVELMNKNPIIFESEDFSSFMDLQILLYLWGEENISELIKVIGNKISKIGRPLFEVAGLLEKFARFKADTENGDGIIIEKFLDKAKEKNITETDCLSELLK